MPQTASVGAKAPAFKLESSQGTVELGGMKGRWVVLYFYPKDHTPGCTTEACEFASAQAAFGRAKAVVLGVSPDPPERHDSFIQKFKLPFALLSDPEHRLCEAYGAWGEKQLYGRKFMGVLRSTFLIGPDGKIRHHWPKVSPKGHAAEVLAKLKELSKGKAS